MYGFSLYPFGLCKTKDEGFGLEEELKGLTVTWTRRVGARSTGEPRTPHQTCCFPWQTRIYGKVTELRFIFLSRHILFSNLIFFWNVNSEHGVIYRTMSMYNIQKYLKKNILKYRPIKSLKNGLKPVKFERFSSRVFSDFWMIVNVPTHVVHVSVIIGNFGTLQITVCPSHSNWRRQKESLKKKTWHKTMWKNLETFFCSTADAPHLFL